MPGERWEPSILRELNESDVIVCQLSRAAKGLTKTDAATADLSIDYQVAVNKIPTSLLCNLRPNAGQGI